MIDVMAKRKRIDPKTFDLAGRLKKWREQMAKAKGIPVYTQEMAAGDLAVPVDTWGNWEQNRRTPKSLTLSALLMQLDQLLERARAATAAEAGA